MNFFVAVCGWGAGLFLSPRYPAFSEGIGMVYVHIPTHLHCTHMLIVVWLRKGMY